MPDRTYLDWPFFDDAHRKVAAELDEWIGRNRDIVGAHVDNEQADTHCRKLVKLLGQGGWLRHAVPAPFGASQRLDVRTICLVRERLAYHSGLADFSFALEGLGSGPISFFGNDDQRNRYLKRVAGGDAISAFAISESEAGSDVAAMQASARRDGDSFVIDGEKTWISNAGIADFYVVFCRFPEAGEKGYVALIVDANTSGMTITKRIAITAAHPLGTVTFQDCRVPGTALVGEPGRGLRAALGVLDVFRPSVGAAALGFARRALDEAAAFAKERTVFGQKLAAMQMTQAKIAEMAMAIDASALLIYRAAWLRDRGQERITREAAMAKLHATESAQWIIDQAVQILGGRGVVRDSVAERLYREVRSLRIYEGTSEIQKLIIAGQVLHG